MATTRGVVDIVFCIDSSMSMKPCIDAVRKHITAFVESMGRHSQQKVDCRLDYVSYACDETNGTYRMTSLQNQGVDLVKHLYPRPREAAFFSADVGAFQAKLNGIEVIGDEATLVAVDFALDFPWRPRAGCHRVVVVLTDEPLETNAHVPFQRAKLPQLIDKVHDLGVMLHVIAPDSPGFRELAEADRSEYQKVDGVGSGLAQLDFGKVLAFIGKSVSMARQGGEERPVARALYGQDQWVGSSDPIRGR